MKFSSFLFIPVLLLTWSCSDKKTGEPAYNVKASLPASFKFDEMGFKVITSSINTKDHTQSTCYGNDIAVNSARSGEHVNYPAGAVIALVTWKQQEDPNWFGGNIPGEVKSVELIKKSNSADSSAVNHYQKFTGRTLRLALAGETIDQNSRINYILGLRAAVMP